MTTPGGNTGLVVLDAGKQGHEHFEFNRGVLLALQQIKCPFRFVGMRSMHDVHAATIDSSTAKTFDAWWSIGPRRCSATAFKLFSAVLAVVGVALTRQTLVVLYATPLAHLTLALASRVTSRRLIVFLHAEIEFMASAHDQPHHIGEKLMRLALRLPSSRVRYLTLTTQAAECVRRNYGLQVTFCPHPISPALLDIPLAATADAKGGREQPVALVFFKSTEDSLCARRLCNRVGREMAVNINGSYCTLPSGAEIWPDIEPLRPLRRFLGRDELERALAGASVYLMPATEDEYQFTASGLACSAASAGAAVVGCANPFMIEYQARYPTHFRVLRITEGEDERLIARPGCSLDNLHEVALVLLSCIRWRGALPS